MSLAPPTMSNRQRKAAIIRSQSPRRAIVKPEDYAKAVRVYSRLPTGAGQNHESLGEFLTSSEEPAISIRPQPNETRQDYVILYPLGQDDEASHSTDAASQQRDNTGSDNEPESASERRRDCHAFNHPHEIFNFNAARSAPQSCLIFLRGYMTAAWINHIGGRYMIDPEFFCRHLDFRPADDYSSNFSLPAVPSSSWYLIELPILTFGTRMTQNVPESSDEIRKLRVDGANELRWHHHQLAMLSNSNFTIGQSMIRDFYVFDQSHFAIEQRISICMQAAEDRSSFTLLIWIDAGAVLPSGQPWSTQPPQSRFLPTIRHQHMIALKGHLITYDACLSATQPQTASLLPKDYGRSMRPSLMAKDAFYCLAEVFSFAASSEMQFLNMVDVKLDKYTAMKGDKEIESLTHLKYTKRILYGHLKKLRQVLTSIENAQDARWPKDETDSGIRKAAATMQSVKQDFERLLDRSFFLHSRVTEAISDLRSSISIAESQKAIYQAGRVGKLTLLAFIFVPLSFTTSFFGMNVSQISDGKLGVEWWIALSLPLTGAAIAAFYIDLSALVKRLWTWFTGYLY